MSSARQRSGSAQHSPPHLEANRMQSQSSGDVLELSEPGNDGAWIESNAHWEGDFQ